MYAVIASATNICDNVVVWDDTLGPWNPPADHYTVDIDGLEVGIGFSYDPNTNTWTAPPPAVQVESVNLEGQL
jgi:hypothetical protein